MCDSKQEAWRLRVAAGEARDEVRPLGDAREQRALDTVRLEVGAQVLCRDASRCPAG